MQKTATDHLVIGCGTTGLAFTNTLLADVPKSTSAGLWTQAQCGQDQALRQRVRDSRLDGFGQLMASAPEDDARKQAVIAAFRVQAMAATANITRLLA